MADFWKHLTPFKCKDKHYLRAPCYNKLFNKSMFKGEQFDVYPSYLKCSLWKERGVQFCAFYLDKKY